MPYTIGLVCYNDAFTTSSNVSIDLVKEYVQGRNDLKLEKEGESDTVFIWYEAQAEWFPLLWISDDSNSINANPIFDFGLYYDLAKLASHLDACIVSEDGYLLYSSKLGFLVDPDESKDISLPVSVIATALESTRIDDLDLVALHKQHSTTASVSNNSNVQKPTISKKTEYLIVVLIFLVSIIVYFFLIKKFR